METGSRSSRWWTVDNGKLEYRRKAFLSVDLYPVIGERFCAGRPSVEVLNGVIAGGARIVQCQYGRKNLASLRIAVIAP